MAERSGVRGCWGGRYGLALGGDADEGVGALALFYEGDAAPQLKGQFERFVHAHVEGRSLPDGFALERVVLCADCGTPVADVVVRKVKERGRASVGCQVCGSEVSLVPKDPTLTRGDQVAVDAMGRSADRERHLAAALSVVEGKRKTESFDVFLCYNSAEKPAVKAVGKALMREGILPWLDEWELPPGVRWRPALERQIERVGAAAVFVGPSGLGPWQDEEIDALLSEFLRRKCPVIPVILPECEEPPDIPPFLRSRGWVDLRSGEEQPLQRLIWGITGERPDRSGYLADDAYGEDRLDLPG